MRVLCVLQYCTFVQYSSMCILRVAPLGFRSAAVERVPDILHDALGPTWPSSRDAVQSPQSARRFTPQRTPLGPMWRRPYFRAAGRDWTVLRAQQELSWSSVYRRPRRFHPPR